MEMKTFWLRKGGTSDARLLDDPRIIDSPVAHDGEHSSAHDLQAVVGTVS